jgi:uncharacterized protein (DUF4415 family)
MSDAEIDYSDIPPLGEEFFKDAQLRLPRPKATVTMRLDADVLEWFRSTGKGYQTRINAILRMYMDAQERRSPPPR